MSEDRRGKSTIYRVRFRAYGQRHIETLGSAAEGWDRARAEQALRHRIADVERGTWRPPTPAAPPANPLDTDPGFHEFASEWFAASEGGWTENTRLDYQWQLSSHLLPFFRGHRLSQITIAEVDRYRTAKIAEARVRADAIARAAAEPDEKRRDVALRRAHELPGLSATSINKTITRLAQILEVAVEYGYLDRNPARGKRRRVKASRPAPVWLDQAPQITALLDAAGKLDREARVDRQVPRRAILATLVYSGLRISELLDLQWRDVDFAAGRITVRASKTDAGRRQIDLLPCLREELDTLKAGHPGAPGDRVFPSLSGGRQGPSNIRRRVLAKAVEVANEQLVKDDQVPLPDGLTPHKLRHTFASLLAALGEEPGVVMDQLGHTDVTFTMRVYRHPMLRDQAAKKALRELVGLVDWATMGNNEASEASSEKMEKAT